MLIPLDIEEKSKAKEESQTLLDTDSEYKDPFIPSERFLFLFRKEWSDFFRKLDDTIISIVQSIHIKKAGQFSILKKGLGYLFWILGEILTYITQVEYGPSLCVLAIIVGYDYIGRWLLIATVSTALVAQIPKRFMFRKRPYMEKRALELEREASSSFPSRSAVCGIVYSYAIMYAYNYKMQYVDNTSDQVFSTFSMILLTFLGGVITSIARIYMGAHYPSDCIVGMVLGSVLVSLCFLFSSLPNIFGCPSCYQQACYPQEGPQAMTPKDFELQNIVPALFSIGVIGLVQITSNCSPVRFWDKSAPIFGTFAACIATEIILACPKDGSRGLVASQELSKSGFIIALVVMQVNLILITTTTELYRKMKNLSWQKSLIWNVGVFTFFSFVFLVTIIKTRLYITSPNE